MADAVAAGWGCRSFFAPYRIAYLVCDASQVGPEVRVRGAGLKERGDVGAKLLQLYEVTMEHMQEALWEGRSEVVELSEEVALQLERRDVYLMLACACAAVQDSVLAHQSGHSVAGPQVSYANEWELAWLRDLGCLPAADDSDSDVVASDRSVGSVKPESTSNASEQGDDSDYSADGDWMFGGDLAGAGDLDYTYVDYTGNPEFCDGGVLPWL